MNANKSELGTITRYVLRSEYRPNQRNYIDFASRLYRCHLLHTNQRKELAVIMYMIKVIKGTYISVLAQRIIRNINHSRNTMNPGLLLLRDLQSGSTFYEMFQIVNRYEAQIDIRLSEGTNKSRIKNRMFRELQQNNQL